jgi:uncharacterized membrane protein YhhN
MNNLINLLKRKIKRIIQKIKIDWFALFFGVLGSFLVTAPSLEIRFIGFICFLIGNILWVLFSFNKPQIHSVMWLNIIYALSSSLGLYYNFPFFK